MSSPRRRGPITPDARNVWLTFPHPEMAPCTNADDTAYGSPPSRDDDYVPGNTAASSGLRPRIKSDALSAIIKVEALRLAEIIRGMIEASTTRKPCRPCTRNSSSTTAHELSAGPIRQVQPG